MSRSQANANGDRWVLAETSPPRAVLETTPEADEARQRQATPEQVVLDLERQTMPEGAGPAAHERRVVPWVVGGLAVLGLLVVSTVIGANEGWRAGLIAAMWVMLAYSVSWIAVWGAGVMRARDEAKVAGEVEELLIESPLKDPPLDPPVRR